MDSDSSPLLDFVTRLQEDEGLRAQYTADPDATMTAAGLLSEDQEVVKSGDLERLTAAIEQDGFTPVWAAIVYMIHFGVSDPGSPAA